MNKFALGQTVYVWQLENGLPLIRPYIINGVKSEREPNRLNHSKIISYAGFYQYDFTGDEDMDIGVTLHLHAENHLFATYIEAHEALKDNLERHYPCL